MELIEFHCLTWCIEKENPNVNRDLPNFIGKAVACVTLKGCYYESDPHKVHQALVALITGQPLEDWLKVTLRYRDGRVSMKSLGNQFEGEGNATRNMTNQSNYTTLFIIRMKCQLCLNYFLPSSRRCTSSLKNKAIQWRMILKYTFSLNKSSTQPYRNQWIY